jgi:hypothetical protein
MKKNAPRKKTTTGNEVPEDLQALVNSLKAISMTHALLQKGMFQYQDYGAVAQAIQYVEILHKQAMSEASAHPKAHLSPELNALKQTSAEATEQDEAFMQVVDGAVNQTEAVQ